MASIKLEPAFFCLDDADAVPGWTSGARWNGFACPYFDESQLPAVLRLFDNDSCSVSREEDIVVLKFKDFDGECGTDTIDPVVIEGKRYWNFGWAYTWHRWHPEDSSNG